MDKKANAILGQLKQLKNMSEFLLAVTQDTEVSLADVRKFVEAINTLTLKICNEVECKGL